MILFNCNRIWFSNNLWMIAWLKLEMGDRFLTLKYLSLEYLLTWYNNNNNNNNNNNTAGDVPYVNENILSNMKKLNRRRDNNNYLLAP